MSRDPLPRQLDVLKLAAAGTDLQALEPIDSFPRFAAMLADSAGEVCIDMAFSRDEQGRHLIDGRVAASVRVECQRCLEPLAQQLQSEFRLGVVTSEERARQLPRELEPLIIDPGPVDIGPAIEDELIISLPFSSYHARLEDCGERAAFMRSGQEEAPAADEPERRENPFNVLEQLKSGD